MGTTIEDLEGMFDAHPSLNASLEDFEQGSIEIEHHHQHQHPLHFGYPSQHSGFRNDSDSEDLADSASVGGYSPPAWRREENGNRTNGFWNRHSNNNIIHGKDLAKRPKARGVSRDSSPEYESADEGQGDAALATAVRTRLPTGSISPEKKRSPSPSPYHATNGDFEKSYHAVVKQEESHEGTIVPTMENHPNNCMKLEVQHRTEPLEAALSSMSQTFSRVTNSWTSLCTAFLALLLSILTMRSLFQPTQLPPVPDLVRVAGLARSFEPLIYYAENGMQHTGDIQLTSMAVWDLSESLRSTNMTSAPVIVAQLDELSESLKTLSLEMARLSTNVGGDVDGLLIVMDWVRRELNQLQHTPPSTLNHAFDNIHSMLSRVGVLETPAGTPTKIGAVATNIFGMTLPQRIRRTLQRTFNEFLSAIEEAVSSELTHILHIFAIFEQIDNQFKAVARSASRELDTQEMDEDKLLSSLWTKLLGPSAGTLHKFEKNKKLLSTIRSKTLQNKSILLDHNGKLLTLRTNLDYMRQKIVSPLVKTNSSTIRIEEQIQGLEDASVYLGRVREKQKEKLMELLYGSGSGSARRVAGAKAGEIEGRWE
ncbi:Cytochrome c-like domain protein [Rutstroemia sp. NJR-2017a BBW]|nr:Cytochrome c-like domain protein [Rutstroemia sp. NJR-2017a BBW]